MDIKFYKCTVCGQVAAIVNETGMPLTCCGKEMSLLVPNTVEAMEESHIPIYKQRGNVVVVTVGSQFHPMTSEHYIQWVAIQTKCGNQRKELKPGQDPRVCFMLCEGDEVEAVYAYCNKHALWKNN